MGEKAPDELGYREGHGLVQITVFGPVVLVLEGDLVVVEGTARPNEPARAPRLSTSAW